MKMCINFCEPEVRVLEGIGVLSTDTAISLAEPDTGTVSINTLSISSIGPVKV